MAPPEQMDGAVRLVVADADELAASDPFLRQAAPYLDHFPIHRRERGFPMLIRSILAQQVSNAAATAMWNRLSGLLDPVAPVGLLALGDDSLRACGFSRQKTGYARAIAEAVRDGRFDIGAVDAMADESAIEALCSLKGIGRWSAECYLLFGLSRRDRFPAGDLALQIGWQRLAGLPKRPSPDALLTAAEAWRPRRTAAAFLLWGYYIGTTPGRR